MGIIIEQLGTAGSHTVSRFSMSKVEDEALRIFIRKHARPSSHAGITKTYIAREEDDKRVVGYVSIMCAEVKLEKTYEIEDKIAANRYEYQPAVRISRLAVEDDSQGKHIGKCLVETALGIILELIEPHVGCRFVILDAKKKSVSFYTDRGFTILDTPENKKSLTPLMWMDIRKLK
jgi:GNAT superfamily N-acetyltransferase